VGSREKGDKEGKDRHLLSIESYSLKEQKNGDMASGYLVNKDLGSPIS
jgi:hypothetical protein